MSSSDQAQILNQLGFRILSVSYSDGNTVISPLAILRNLIHTLQGSGSEILISQINQLLHLNPNEKEKNVKEMADLVNAIIQGDPKFVTINLPCGVCVPTSVDCEKYSSLENIIFSKGNDYKDNVNAQVSSITENRIKSFLADSHVEPKCGITLFGAMDFKAVYLHPFIPACIEIKDFQMSPTQSIKIPLMRYGSMQMYNDDKEIGVRMMRHIFMGGNFDIVVMVPMEKFGLAEMEKKLTAEKYLELLKGMRPVLGAISFPKMSLDHITILKNSFEALGLKMDDPNSLIEHVVHGISVNLNGFGSNVPVRELMGHELCGPCLGGFRKPPERQEVIADEPFLLAVNYTKSNTMVLLSRVLHPTIATDH